MKEYDLVRQSTTRALETRRSISCREVANELDLSYGMVHREMDAMRREGLIAGRKRMGLYWPLPRDPETKPIVVSLRPIVGGEPLPDYERIDCIDPDQFDDQIGRFVGDCVRDLSNGDVGDRSNGSTVISIRLS